MPPPLQLYMAPEVMDGDYTVSVDMFSFGMTVTEIVLGYMPEVSASRDLAANYGMGGRFRAVAGLGNGLPMRLSVCCVHCTYSLCPAHLWFGLVQTLPVGCGKWLAAWSWPT